LLLSALWVSQCKMPRSVGRASMLGNRTRVIWEAAQHWAAEHVGPACAHGWTTAVGGQLERAVLLPGSPGLMTIV
jgi:hypothetical protein